MKKAIRRLFIDIRGVAAVEFALIAPFLGLLALGIYDVGSYLNTGQKVNSTARAVAQYVALGGDVDNIDLDVLANSSLDLTDEEIEALDVTAVYVCECSEETVVDCDGGECLDEDDYVRRFIEININMQYTPLFDYMGLPATYDLNGYSRIQVASP